MKNRDLLNYFAGKSGGAVGKLSDAQLDGIQEIRLRVNRPAAVCAEGKILYITENGQLTYNPQTAAAVSEQDIRRTFEAVCQYSVHSFQREISQGFITVAGGHRVGFCGTPVVRDGKIENIKNINAMNFRVAREVIGCSEKLFRDCFSDGLCSLLIAGAPSSGKTTVLRDLTRLLGGRFKVSAIDERGEIAASRNGVPQNDVGVNTDVFDGYGKAEGISAAVRVMSPQMIVCDEIGSEEDFSAIRGAALSGVYTAASVHAADMSDLCGKFPREDLEIFDRIAFLSGMGKISSTVKTRTEKEW
ncbi:MAG: Flp pilus assembly complex ATPase component TadA [Prevotella sp.]|nr:Flp pilus assembly complex ATPase component TadA [Prevotella sp.]